jgi:hypothetical protein
MANATNYLELKVLDHVLSEGVRSYTPSTSLHLALLTAVADGEAGTVTEVTGNNYARVAITFNAASSGSVTNNGDITFPTASGGAFGTITHVGIYDASTSGNLLIFASLAASKTVSDGDTFVIQNNNLQVNMA